MRSFSWALSLWACLGIASCSRSHSEAGDSSTHWLQRCGSDDQCGGLSCVCGVCSSECSATNECAGLGSSAVCATGAVTECGTSAGSAPRLCDQTCERDQDCGAGGLRCVQQRCRRELGSGAQEDAATQSPAPTDASASAALDSAPEASDAGGVLDSATLVRDGSSLPADSATDAARALNQLSFLCPPQRARSNNDPCDRNAGYAWNGASCEPIICGCEGEDCAAVAPTRSECEAAFVTCQPTSQCSGVPWYRCNDFCPAHWVLYGGGRVFGLCGGDCRYELLFNPNIVLDVGGCMKVDADLTIFNTAGTQRRIHMQLTDAAWKEAALLSLALEGADIAPVTGCPDCVDQGEGWFSRLGANGEIEKFRHGFRDPAPGVRAVDEFVQRVIDQGKECRGDLLVSCSEQ